MNRLTPWSNDPTSDPPGEVIYLRDEETGEFWTPTPLPLGPRATVTVRHGQGYTRYTHVSRDLNQDLLVFVPTDDPIKLVCLTVRNDGDRPRRLSATYYAEWVLGTVRENAPLQVVCERDPESAAILARNAWAGAFAEKIAFAASGSPAQSVTADRTEFLGEHGSVVNARRPEARRAVRPRGPGPRSLRRSDDGTDAGSWRDERSGFRLGSGGQFGGGSSTHSRLYAIPSSGCGADRRYNSSGTATLNALQVTTPDPGIDLMLNRWLVYQVLACRIWARSAFYQSGGAYGFRDQLQDVMALVYSAPAEARAQILRSAARQFEEGDVQHWWHPPVRDRRTHANHRRPLFPAARRSPLCCDNRRHGAVR